MAPLPGRRDLIGARGTHSGGLCRAVGGGGAGGPHAAWHCGESLGKLGEERMLLAYPLVNIEKTMENHHF